MKYLFKPAILIWIAFMLYCCKDKTVNPAQSSFNSFDREGMLTNIGNNIIIPSYTSFSSSTDSLYILTQQFITNHDSSSLINLQHQWLRTNLTWKSCETFNFGASLTTTYNNNIQYSPFIATGYTDPASIESVINSSPLVYDSSFVSKQASGVRGISAMEYLLFDPINGNAGVLNKYVSNSNARQRLNYLKGLIQDIRINAHNLLDSWLPSGDNYIQTFITANGNDINSSLGFLVNQMVYQTDFIKNYKIGRPLGIRIKASNGAPLPAYVETYYSSNALKCLMVNYKTLDNVFFGVGNNGTRQPGLSNFLDALNSQYNGQLVSSLVRQRLDSIYIQINAFPVPLEQAVMSDQDKVNALYLSAKQLLVLFKLDMVNSFGVVLTTTDNDGD